ncbi:septum formation family protein [Myceligenerans crystallogenes]|uniref:Septum formation-related domain-containing protein n=1 Tax=Myceligenerans crystallogenes TaxID=316335 RepID=A0ABN2NBC2_9MICO
MFLRTTSPVRRRRPGRRSTRQRLAALGATALLAGTLTGCSAVEGLLGGGGGEPEVTRDSEGQVTAETTTAPGAAQVGDCLGTIPQGTFTELPVVPCDKEHRGEIYAEKKLPEGKFPGDKQVADEGNTFCKAEFATFVGMPFDESELYFVAFYPTKGSWAENDRLIQCVLEAEKPTTGTLEGAER